MVLVLVGVIGVMVFGVVVMVVKVVMVIGVGSSDGVIVLGVVMVGR